MNLRQLELFISLAKRPSISRVAKEHYLTQGAVSVALKGLEEDLGVPLFDRLSRRLVLNANGREFLAQLEPVVDRLHEVLRIFEGDHMSGSIVVGASSTIADFILPQILFEFNDRYPKVNIETVFTEPAQIADGVVRGSIDLGLIEATVKRQSLEYIRLCSDEVFVVSTDEEFAKGGPYTFEELLDKKWVLREPGAGSRVTFDHYAAQYMDRLNIVLELHHTEAVKHVLQNPDTLSCMSPFAIQQELDEGELFHVYVSDISFKRNFKAVIHKDRYRTRVLDKFLHAVEAYLPTDRLLFREDEE